LKDLHSDQILHLELAVKFYLQVPGFNPAHIAWIGAGQRDFFHQKVNRLFSHQLRLSDIAYDSRCWPSDLPLPDHKALWMPGRLYLPHTAGSVSFDQQTMSGTPWQINPEVQQSVWFETGQLEESSLKPLAKTGWLRGMTFIEQNRQLPAQFCHPDHPAPVYVLPLNWQTDAQNALNDYKATL